MRSRRAVVAATLLAMSTAAAPAAAGPDRARPRLITIPVLATYVEPSSELDGLRCRGLAQPRVARDTCRGVVSGVASFSGVMHGEETYELDFWLLEDGRMAFEGSAVFPEGGIVGCGRGGFEIEAFDGVLDYPRTDPSTRETRGSNRWRIVPGSGTKGLEGRLVAGQGSNAFVIRNERAGTAEDDFGEGTFTGSITCRR